MREIDCCSVLLKLPQTGEFTPIVCRDAFERDRETFFVVTAQIVHCAQNSIACFSCDTENEYLLCTVFDQGGEYLPFPFTPSDYGIDFPMTEFRVVVDMPRAFVDASAVMMVLLYCGMTHFAPFPTEDTRAVFRLDSDMASMEHYVERARTST